jgi:hypothetical protein
MDKKGVILLNNLFNGEYIKDKLGGEIINMFQADNKRFYIYVNPYGNISKQWDNKITQILFIRSVGNGIVKVIGKAEILKQISLNAVRKLNQGIDKYQKEFIDSEQISYGGVKVYEIGSWSNYFITFEAKSINKAKKDIYLTTSKTQNFDSNNVLVLENIGKINNQSQKLYIEPGSINYSILENLIKKDDLWEKAHVGLVDLKGSDNRSESLLSIIQKEDDELVNSNLLAHFLVSDGLFWSDFVLKILRISDIKLVDATPVISRETVGNIDLYIETEEHIIVIENKIKSGISGDKKSGYSQLSKYFEIALENNTSNKKLHFFVLRPNYNNENYQLFKNGKNYIEIKYSQIYEIIKNRSVDFYFEEFKKVVKKHSAEYNNELFEIMNDRFIQQITKKQVTKPKRY